jgi:hypothetical protein
LKLPTRLTRLERTAKARAGHAADVSSQARLEAIAYVMSEDPAGRSIWSRLRALTPQAQGDPKFDCMAAANARPEVAESVLALSNRWRQVMGMPPPGNTQHHGE